MVNTNALLQFVPDSDSDPSPLSCLNLSAPGEGPPREVREKGYFWIDLYAKGHADGKEVMIRGVAGSHHGDGGYTETAKVCEALL